jgi:VWFA-related protein
MTELIAEDPTLRATIDVSYQWDQRAELMVPAEMHERYEGRRDGAVIVGVASYGKIRQFQIQANERLGPAAQADVDQPNPTTTARSSEPPSDRGANDVSVKEALANRRTDSDAPLFPLPVPSTQDLTKPPTFKTGSELVLVDFVVTDKANRPVRGLSAKDFVVKEDGKERPIVSFEAFGTADASAPAPSSARGAAPPLPLEGAAPRPPDASTVVLVDDAHLTPDQAARLRPALKGLLRTVGGRSGSLMLVAPGSKVSVLAVLPTGAGEMVPAVDKIVGQRTEEHTTFPVADAEALAIARRDDRTIARVAARFVTFNPELSRDQAVTIAIEHGIKVAHDARVRRDAMYDVALLCLDWLAARRGRHSVIIVSGGFATDPDDAKYFEVVTRSLRANAPIDFLDARGLSGFGRYHDVEFGPALSRNADEGPFGRFEAAEGSTGLAVDTGGIIVANTNDMEKGLDELLETMTTYYVLAYQPPTHDKPGYRKIKVEVRTKGLHVRARTGYRSGPP